MGGISPPPCSKHPVRTLSIVRWQGWILRRFDLETDNREFLLQIVVNDGLLNYKLSYARQASLYMPSDIAYWNMATSVFNHSFRAILSINSRWRVSKLRWLYFSDQSEPRSISHECKQRRNSWTCIILCTNIRLSILWNYISITATVLRRNTSNNEAILGAKDDLTWDDPGRVG